MAHILGKNSLPVIGTLPEQEVSLVREIVKSGLTRAKWEGQRIGMPKFAIGRDAALQDRLRA